MIKLYGYYNSNRVAILSWHDGMAAICDVMRDGRLDLLSFRMVDERYVTPEG